MSSGPGEERIAQLLDAAASLATATTTARIVRARAAALAGEPTSHPIPTLDAEQVEAALRAAWGENELDEFDPEPAAVTPTSQVHRATLEGEPVAVKLLRPGLAKRIRQELVLFETLSGPLGLAFPRLDASAMIREARARLLDELDLEHEAGAQRRLHRALRRHPYLSVPAPVTRLATEHVAVSAWAEGTPILKATDRDAAAAKLLVFVLGAGRAGLVHADPDPDDVLVAPDGSLTILDFGATGEIDPARADHLLATVEAFIDGHPERLGAALDALGVLSAEHGAVALELAQHALGPLGESEPQLLDRGALEQAGARLQQRREQALELAFAANLRPEDLWPARGLVQLTVTLARVAPTASWPELVREALAEGWQTTAR